MGFEKVGSREVDPALLTAPSVEYSIIGSWNNWSACSSMMNDGSGYTYTVELGEDGHESFQILVDGDPNSVLHPDVADACPHIETFLCGPSTRPPLGWTIGLHSADEGRPGRRYEVKLHMYENIPVAVDWAHVGDAEDVREAENQE